MISKIISTIKTAVWFTDGFGGQLSLSDRTIKFLKLFVGKSAAFNDNNFKVVKTDTLEQDYIYRNIYVFIKGGLIFNQTHCEKFKRKILDFFKTVDYDGLETKNKSLFTKLKNIANNSSPRVEFYRKHKIGHITSNDATIYKAPKNVRPLLHPNYEEFDMKNCHPTLLVSMLKTMDFSGQAKSTIELLTADIDALVKEYNITPEDAKVARFRTLYGGGCKDSLSERWRTFVKTCQAELLTFIGVWLDSPMWKDKWQELFNVNKKIVNKSRNWEFSFLSLLLQHTADCVIQHVLIFFREAFGTTFFDKCIPCSDVVSIPEGLLEAEVKVKGISLQEFITEFNCYLKSLFKADITFSIKPPKEGDIEDVLKPFKMPQIIEIENKPEFEFTPRPEALAVVDKNTVAFTELYEEDPLLGIDMAAMESMAKPDEGEGVYKILATIQLTSNPSVFDSVEYSLSYYKDLIKKDTFGTTWICGHDSIWSPLFSYCGKKAFIKVLYKQRIKFKLLLPKFVVEYFLGQDIHSITQLSVAVDSILNCCKLFTKKINKITGKLKFMDSVFVFATNTFLLKSNEYFKMQILLEKDDVLDVDKKDLDKVRAFYLNFFEDKLNLDFFLIYVRKALEGRVHKQTLLVVGPRDSGKSALIRLLGEAFPGVTVPFGGANLLKNKLNSRDAELTLGFTAQWDKARLALASELPTEGVLNTYILRKLTGGDMLTVRELREKPVVIKNQATIILFANDVPQIDDVEGIKHLHIMEMPFVINSTLKKAEQNPKRHVHIEQSEWDFANSDEGLKAFRALVLRGLGTKPVLKETQAMIDLKNDTIAGFRQDDGLSTILKKLFKAGNDDDFIPFTDIKMMIGVSAKSLDIELKVSPYKISKTLQDLGYLRGVKRINGKKVRGFKKVKKVNGK